MKTASVILSLAAAAPVWSLCPMARRALDDPAAFEGLLHGTESPKEKRQTGPAGLPFTSFNENQEIDVTGLHRWIAPGPGDIRGPCPGLNALSNHGFFPRNGVVPLQQAATATNRVYGLSLDFGEPLTVYATLVDGNVIDQSWSIGGKPPQTLVGPLIGPGDGLSGSHNKYEGDASPGRGDYYLYNGDVESLRVEKFKALYDIAKNDPVPNYNLDVLIKHRKYTFEQSKNTNPYFFFAPFSGVAVSNAAHTFIPALMSNHSAAYPNGILDKETLKSFFAITERPDGTLTWQPGYERIPNNWYRRPLGLINEYSPQSFNLDLVKIAEKVPQAVSVGGNTGTVNSYAAVNLGDLTGGAYQTTDLLNPPQFVCYFYQLTLAVVPDFLRSRALGTLLASALNLLHSKIDPYVDPECAKIGNYNDSFLAQFPGAALNKP